MPASWRHYIIGSRHLNKQRARESLKLYHAAAAAFGSGKARENWVREQQQLAGWEE